MVIFFSENFSVEQNFKEMAATKVPEVRDITRIERIGKLFSIFVDVNETFLLFYSFGGQLTMIFIDFVGWMNVRFPQQANFKKNNEKRIGSEKD